MNKKITNLLLLLVSLPLVLIGQNISGTVLDSEMETPLPGATIVLVSTNSNLGIIADENGHFILNKLEPGRHTIQISFIGYEPQTVPNILVKTGKDAELIVRLKLKINEVKEVVISGSKQRDMPLNQMASVSVRSFSVEQTEKYAGSLGDPSRMAQNYAGVLMAGDQRNDIVIRGNAPSGLLWRLDGLPIPNPNHFGAAGSTGGPVSMLNNNLLARSDFYTGAFPAEFGNAISGVFDLRMRSGNKQRRQSVFQIGFNGFELGTEGPFKKDGKASYLVNYRYSTLSVMDKLGFSVAGGAVPQYQDVTFKMDFPTAKAGRFQVYGLGGKSNIFFEQQKVNENAYNNDLGVNTRNGSKMAAIGLNHDYFFTSNTRIRTQLGFSGHQVRTKVDSSNFDTDETWIYYGEDNQELNAQFKSTLKHRFSKKTYAELGFRLLAMEADYNDSVAIERNDFRILTESNSQQLFLAEGFTQIKHFISDKVSASGGIHFQYLDFNKSKSLEPRASLKWQANPIHSFGLGYGLHSQIQPLLVYFTQTYQEDGSAIKTNSDLGMTKSHQFAVNHNWMFSENFHTRLEAYYQYLYNVPVESDASPYSILNYGANFHQARIDSLVNKGNGRNYGLELTIEQYLNDGFYFLLTGTLYQSKYKTLDDTWRNTQFNGNFITNALVGYELKIGKNLLGIDLRTVYAGGKRLRTINIEASKQQANSVYDTETAFEQHADPYFRTDLRLSFKMSMKKFSSEFAIDFQNLTNHKNIYSQYFDVESGTVKYNYQSPFTPMFLYRINF